MILILFLVFVLLQKSECYQSSGNFINCNGRIGQIPNPRDPYSFYKCDSSGKAHLFICAKGTRYDTQTKICDWEDVVLEKMYGKVSQGGYTDGTWERYEVTNKPNYKNCNRCQTQTNKQYTGCPNGNCNTGHGFGGHKLNDNRMDCSSNYGPTRLYQNPNDCSTFYTCNMGRPVLTYCPRGLNFNPKIQGCDDTIQLGCKVQDKYQQGGSAIYEYRHTYH